MKRQALSVECFYAQPLWKFFNYLPLTDFSRHDPNSATCITPDYTINYAKALVSRGDLPNAINLKATLTGADMFFT